MHEVFNSYGLLGFCSCRRDSYRPPRPSKFEETQLSSPAEHTEPRRSSRLQGGGRTKQLEARVPQTMSTTSASSDQQRQRTERKSIPGTLLTRTHCLEGGEATENLHGNEYGCCLLRCKEK